MNGSQTSYTPDMQRIYNQIRNWIVLFDIMLKGLNTYVNPYVFLFLFLINLQTFRNLFGVLCVDS